jgi:hypothetical protein
MAIRIPSLDRITRALGYICIFWAWLEDTIGEAIETLTPLDQLKVTDEQRKKIGRLISANDDIRDKIKMLRALALIRSWDPAWYEKLDTLLNHIDNDLRPRRNRFIHDQWFKPRGKLEQLSRAAKIQRPQAFAALELSLERRTPVRMPQVWSLAIAILKAQIKLIQLYLEFGKVQKYMDQEVEKIVQKRIVETILAQPDSSPSTPPVLNPRPAPSTNPQRSQRSKQKRQL